MTSWAGSGEGGDRLVHRRGASAGVSMPLGIAWCRVRAQREPAYANGRSAHPDPTRILRVTERDAEPVVRERSLGERYVADFALCTLPLRRLMLPARCDTGAGAAPRLVTLRATRAIPVPAACSALNGAPAGDQDGVAGADELLADGLVSGGRGTVADESSARTASPAVTATWVKACRAREMVGADRRPAIASASRSRPPRRGGGPCYGRMSGAWRIAGSPLART